MIAIHEVRLAPNGHLHAYFLDIGQGDATLLISPSGRRILIDGGPDNTVLQRIGGHLPLLDRRIDLLVATHPDSDHTAGLVEVLRRYDVQTVLIAGVWHDTATYRMLLQEIVRQHIPIVVPDPSTDIRFDDGLTFDVLWPRPGQMGKTPDDTNNVGIVLRALSPDFSVLLTGDIEAPAETAILQTGQDLAADILKVAHHGSKTSSGTGFLLAASPRFASISAGMRNSYGHPHTATLDRLRALGIPLAITFRDGEITDQGLTSAAKGL